MSRFGQTPPPAPAAAPATAPAPAPADNRKVQIDTDDLLPGELLYMVLLEHVQEASLDVRLELASALNEGVEFAKMGKPLRKLFVAAEDQLFDAEEDEDDEDDEDEEDEDE